MANIRLGEVVTRESTHEYSGARFHLKAVKTGADGSRRIEDVGHLRFPLTPAGIEGVFRQGGPTPILWGVTWRTHVGRYLPYLAEDQRAVPTTIQEVLDIDLPTNQVPYVLYMQEHLSKVAHELVDNTLLDVFDHMTAGDGFSPHNTTLTTDQQARFELLSRNVRRLVGVLWDQLNAVVALDPRDEVAWKAGVREQWPKIEKVCGYCSGRGWKRRLLRDMDRLAWDRRHSADLTGAFYFERNEQGAIVPGDHLHGARTALMASLENFNEALRYHEQTGGDETLVHAEAIQSGISGILAGQ